MNSLYTKSTIVLLLLNGTIINNQVNTQLVFFKLQGHTKPIKSVAISNDDTVIASIAPEEPSVRLWYREPTGTFKTDQCIVLPHKATNSAFNRNTSLFATAGYDGLIRVFHKNELGHFTSEEPILLNGHTKKALTVDFSPNNTMLASTSEDGTIRIWYKDSNNNFNVKNCTILSHPTKKFKFFFYPHPAAFFDCSSKSLMVRGFDKNIYLWHADETGHFDEKSYTILAGHKGYVTSACFSSDGKTIISGSEDKTIKVWQQNQDGKFSDNCTTLKGHDGWIKHIVINHDNNAIISTSNDGTMRLWERTDDRIYTSKQSTILTKNTQNLGNPSFNSDDSVIINSVFNTYLALWIKNLQGFFSDKKSDRRTAPTEFTDNITTTAFFHTLKNYAVSNGTDNNVYVWQIILPQPVNHLHLKKENAGKECCICFEETSAEKKLQYLPCYLTEAERNMQKKHYEKEAAKFHEKYEKLKNDPSKEKELKKEEKELNEKRITLELGVKHTEPICSTCLKNLITTKGTCPLCRNPLFEGQN